MLEQARRRSLAFPGFGSEEEMVPTHGIGPGTNPRRPGGTLRPGCGPQGRPVGALTLMLLLSTVRLNPIHGREVVDG